MLKKLITLSVVAGILATGTITAITNAKRTARGGNTNQYLATVYRTDNGYTCGGTTSNVNAWQNLQMLEVTPDDIKCVGEKTRYDAGSLYIQYHKLDSMYVGYAFRGDDGLWGGSIWP